VDLDIVNSVTPISEETFGDRVFDMKRSFYVKILVCSSRCDHAAHTRQCHKNFGFFLYDLATIFLLF